MARIGRLHQVAVISDKQYLDAVRTHTQLIGSLAVKHPTATIESCPQWLMGDLLWHMGEVLMFWQQVVDKKALDTTELEWVTRPEPRNLVQWYTDGVASAIDTLTNIDRDMPCWTWTGVQNVAWIIRRMAHESAVHMWDACQAAGVEAPLQSELSSDGIDEFLHVMLPHAREAQPIVGGSVHVHCTDVEGEWLAVPGDADVMTVTREHAKGSCAIRGTANDLNLLLWRRLSSFDVEVIGDASVAERFLMRTSLD